MSASDKTEQPTAKKKKDERKKGNVAKSKEVSNAFTLIGAVICIYTTTNGLIKNLKTYIASALTMDFSGTLNGKMAHGLFADGLFTYLKLFLPMGMIILCLGVISNIVQSGVVISKESMKPKFSKLNPMKGLKNMFSQKSFVAALKNTILLILLSYIGYSFVKKNYVDILKIGDIYFPHLIYSKGMKMTKQEVKEEFKQAEGDPHVKSQIKQKQRQIASQRMIQNTKDATAIITNPTHISIAIRYERERDSAPIVIAKGADVLAMKIREIAKENDIPMIENVPLARMLYREVEVEQEIPAEMYQEVAEVLVAVYKIKNRYKKNK